jgi:type VI secretion system secreted protein Hcp
MAANMFVKILKQDTANPADPGSKDGWVMGDATEVAHKDWIPVKSVGWSVERAVDLSDLGSTQRGYANVNFAKLAVTSELHKASAELMKLAANGRAKTIVVHQCRVTDVEGSAMETYLEWILTDGQVTKYEVTASEDGVPEETWELGYRKIELNHQLIDARTFAKIGNPIQFTWNLELGAPS